jgi:hypothetical protein
MRAVGLSIMDDRSQILKRTIQGRFSQTEAEGGRPLIDSEEGDRSEVSPNRGVDTATVIRFWKGAGVISP